MAGLQSKTKKKQLEFKPEWQVGMACENFKYGVRKLGFHIKRIRNMMASELGEFYCKLREGWSKEKSRTGIDSDDRMKRVKNKRDFDSDR